jgi:hypothetical protein
VLFLDEAGEFGAHALDALRQPLETGSIEIHRAGFRAIFPLTSSSSSPRTRARAATTGCHERNAGARRSRSGAIVEAWPCGPNRHRTVDAARRRRSASGGRRHADHDGPGS